MREYQFLRGKIQRQIEWNGIELTFTRMEEDKYHRADHKVSNSVKGVYHQATSYQQKHSNEASVTSTKPKPMFLCLYEDGKSVKKGDSVQVNEKSYFVSGIENVQELNVALEISLEENV